jgi:hypothetical protein
MASDNENNMPDPIALSKQLQSSSFYLKPISGIPLLTLKFSGKLKRKNIDFLLKNFESANSSKKNSGFFHVFKTISTRIY